MEIRNSVAYSRTYATSLLKGMRLLKLFTRESPEWGVGEMSVAIGSAKSTVSRIARTLETEGFLRRGSDGVRYRLGLALWDLGCQAVGDGVDFQRRVRPCLEEIVAAVGESAHAVILDGREALHVEKVDCGRGVQVITTFGDRYPLHSTATGKCLLAFQPEHEIEAILHDKLVRFTERTITDPAKMRRELKRVRSRGVATSKGEWRADIGSIAAPVHDRTGHVIGAATVTMPITRYSKQARAEITDVLLEATRRLSREFGYVPASQNKKKSIRQGSGAPELLAEPA